MYYKCLGAAGRAEMDPVTVQPSLLLLRDMSEQAAMDAGVCLEELQGLLDLLKLSDRYGFWGGGHKLCFAVDVP